MKRQGFGSVCSQCQHFACVNRIWPGIRLRDIVLRHGFGCVRRTEANSRHADVMEANSWRDPRLPAAPG